MHEDLEHIKGLEDLEEFEDLQDLEDLAGLGHLEDIDGGNLTMFTTSGISRSLRFSRSSRSVGLSWSGLHELLLQNPKILPSSLASCREKTRGLCHLSLERGERK